MSKCKSCGAEIVWIRTAGGKNMPLNAEKHYFHRWTDGDLHPRETFFTESGAAFAGYGTVKEDPEAMEGRVSHFATCPFADQHRRR